MGNKNIQRLKKKLGLQTNNDVDVYFEIIDRVYYQNQGSVEKFDEETEITTWFFEDGRTISLGILDITHMALFLMALYNDVDEQLSNINELEGKYFDGSYSDIFFNEKRWKLF